MEAYIILVAKGRSSKDGWPFYFIAKTNQASMHSIKETILVQRPILIN